MSATNKHPLRKFFQCERKRGFPSESQANKAIEKMMFRRDARRIDLLATYNCPHCHCWHFGHRKEKKDELVS